MNKAGMVFIPESTDRRSGRTDRLRFTSGAILLLALALGFNLLFTWTAFGNLYRDSIASKLERIGRSLQKQLEHIVQVGRESEDEWSSFSNSLKSHESVRRLAGDPQGPFVLDKLLHEVHLSFERRPRREGNAFAEALTPLPITDLSISLVLRGEPLLAVPHVSSPGGRVPFVALPSRGEGNGAKVQDGAVSCSEQRGQCLVSFPVRDSQGHEGARLNLAVPEGALSGAVSRAHLLAILAAGFIFLSGAPLLAFLLRGFAGSGMANHRSQRRKVSLAVFVVIASAQLLLSTFNVLAFSTHAWREARHDAEMTARMLGAYVEGLLETGGAQGALSKAETVMESIVEESPQFSRIRLLDKNGRLIHLTPRNTVELPAAGIMEEVKNLMGSLLPTMLHHEAREQIVQGKEVKGYVMAGVTTHFLWGKLAKVIADALTVVVISILFLVELLILGFELLLKKSAEVTGGRLLRAEIMRPAAFLFVFGIDISVSFLPLHMKGLYQPIMGLSKDFVMGLPISIEFVFVGLTILIAGAWVDRRGWHEPFIIGLSLAAGGVLYSWLAPDAIHFILSRAVAGAGYGLSLMASQGFVIHFSEKKCKAHGLAQLFAGIYAGSICGSATGAMLAEKLGYEAVFCIGAAVLFGTLVYTFLFMRGYMERPIQPPVLATNPGPRNRKYKAQRFINFLFNRTVLSLIFFSSLPASIGVVGLLNYFSPIYLTQMGASQSTIGRVLMLYGISLIYLGPVISRHVDASNDKRLYVFSGCVLGGMTFLSFHMFQGIWAAVLAVLLLGLSSSFVLASQSAYVLQLPVTRELGEGKAIGIFRSSSRIGQALGPMVFSAVMSRGNINDGIAFFGLMYLLTAFLFLLMNTRKPRASVLGEIGGI